MKATWPKKKLIIQLNQKQSDALLRLCLDSRMPPQNFILKYIEEEDSRRHKIWDKNKKRYITRRCEAINCLGRSHGIREPGVSLDENNEFVFSPVKPKKGGAHGKR